jgi:hypothetical protein
MGVSVGNANSVQWTQCGYSYLMNKLWLMYKEMKEGLRVLCAERFGKEAFFFFLFFFLKFLISDLIEPRVEFYTR